MKVPAAKFAVIWVGLLALVASALGASPAGAANTTAFARLAVNVSKDRSTARAINLKSTDLPGWQQTPNQSSSSDQGSSDLAACVGALDPAKVDIVNVYSPYFDKGPTEVSSDVVIVRARNDALSDLQAMRGGKLKPCVQQVMVPYLKSQMPAGTAITKFAIAMLNLSWVPAESFAFRLNITISVKHTHAELSADTIGFVAGRAEIELDLSQEGPTPPSQALERRLLSVLVARAEQQGVATS